MNNSALNITLKLLEKLDVKISSDVIKYSFEQHPFPESLTAISLLPEKEDYLLEITFSQLLTTSYGKNIDFRQEMQGQARIITESRSVLHRIFERWHDLLKN